MEKTRIPCAASNFKSGRPPGMRPEAIVLHRTGGSADEIRIRFLDGGTSMSAHYVVAKDGGVLQYVDEKDTAFHAGLAINPTWKLLKPQVNPNFYTIGIELEGSATDPVPVEQSEVCAELVAEVAARCHMPIDEDHIVLHSEIRSSRDCPGTTFVRGEFVQRALLAASSAPFIAAPGQVDILRDTNLREGLPSASARIVSVLRAGSKIGVNGFTLRGEPVKGNSAWYQTEDGDFFWAGNSSVPEPRPRPEDDESAPAAPPEPASSADMSTTILPTVSTDICRMGISEIDQFFANPSCAPLKLEQAGREAVGTIQDLLTGHGFAKLPSILSPGYGAISDATRKALCDFQNSCGLPVDAVLTTQTMKQLVGVRAKDPRATQAHFSLVLGMPFTGMDRILALTAQIEGVGKFAALNLNTDLAGLSFGIIQWAQRPGRLIEIVLAFRAADRDEFGRILVGGDPALADGLVAHLKKPFGGVGEKTGITTDPQFNLIASPWAERFKEAALQIAFQKVQVNLARVAFENSLARLRHYDNAQLVHSERAVAFMLDVANQFGDGRLQRPPTPPDRGLAGIYRRVIRQGMTEQDLLEAIADVTIAAMAARFQPGVRARRTLFLTTPLLSSQEFESNSAGQAS